MQKRVIRPVIATHETEAQFEAQVPLRHLSLDQAARLLAVFTVANTYVQGAVNTEGPPRTDDALQTCEFYLVPHVKDPTIDPADREQYAAKRERQAERKKKLEAANKKFYKEKMGMEVPNKN